MVVSLSALSADGIWSLNERETKTIRKFWGKPHDVLQYRNGWVFLIPEVLVEGFASNLSKLMQPVCDAIWSATGIEDSAQYDAEGAWRKS